VLIKKLPFVLIAAAVVLAATACNVKNVEVHGSYEGAGIRDVSIGMIFQGNTIPFNDEGLTQYAKSGFTSVTRFGSFLKI